MEGLARALGCVTHVDFCGVTLRAQGRLLRHLGEIEAQIIKSRVDPMALARSIAGAFSPDAEAARDVVKTVFQEAKAWRMVTPTESQQWLQTWRGKCFAIYLAIRENDPTKYTLDYVTRSVCDHFEDLERESGPQAATEWLDGLLAEIRQASGEDDSGNSIGGQPSPAMVTATG